MLFGNLDYPVSLNLDTLLLKLLLKLNEFPKLYYFACIIRQLEDTQIALLWELLELFRMYAEWDLALSKHSQPLFIL